MQMLSHKNQLGHNRAPKYNVCGHLSIFPIALYDCQGRMHCAALSAVQAANMVGGTAAAGLT